MENQKLTAITRGLQHAAAETNAMVAEQYIRVLSQYFDKDENGTLSARMVRVQLDEQHHAFVPLVSLATPAGLALDRMRVELSIRLEGARDMGDTPLLRRVKGLLGEGHAGNATAEGDAASENRADFSVSLSPRGRGEKKRQSDHVHVDLEFRSIKTPEAVQRMIETYTNMIQPLRTEPGAPGSAPNPAAPTPPPLAGSPAG